MTLTDIAAHPQSLICNHKIQCVATLDAMEPFLGITITRFLRCPAHYLLVLLVRTILLCVHAV